MGGKMPWSAFGNLLYWGILNFLMMDAMVGLGTAVSSNVEQANYVLMPFQIFAGLFNGFALTKISAPSFLKWIFYISPVSYSMEDIAHFNYGQDPVIWNTLVEYNGLEWNESTVVVGTAITLVFVIVGRIGEMSLHPYGFHDPGLTDHTSSCTQTAIFPKRTGSATKRSVFSQRFPEVDDTRLLERGVV